MWKRTIEILISYEVNSDDPATPSVPDTAIPSVKAIETPPLVITRGSTASNVDRYNEVIRISQNRVDFKYVSTLGAAADTLKIDVYNLSLDTLAALMDNRLKSITMLVGYEDQELSVLMDGYISNVAGRKAIPNHITSIWAVPKFQYMLSKKAPINKTQVKYGRLVDVINNLCTQIGFTSTPKYFNMTDDVLEEYIQGYVFDGTPKQALRNLGAQYGFFVKPTNNTVNIVARLSAPDSCSKLADGRITRHILAMNKVKGTPEASIGEMNITYNLDASITAGDIMDCVSLIGAGNEGKPPANSIVNVNAPNNIMYRSDSLWKSMIYQLYLIRNVVHMGSNYSNTWDTQITGAYYVGGTACRNPGNGDPGFDDTGASDIDMYNEESSIPDMRTFTGDSGQEGGSANQWLGTSPDNFNTSEEPVNERVEQPDYEDEPNNSPKEYGSRINNKPPRNNREGRPTPSRISQAGPRRTGVNQPQQGSQLSPAWSRLANIIGKGEGDYDIVEGGANLGLTNMTIGQVKAEQQKIIDRNDRRTPAMGRYQQMPDALRENQAAVGLSDDDKFSVENQDKMFQASILNKRNLEEYLNGTDDISDETAANRIAAEYAAVKQTNGRGRYDYDGVNNATIESSDIISALNDIKDEIGG